MAPRWPFGRKNKAPASTTTRTKMAQPTGGKAEFRQKLELAVQGDASAQNWVGYCYDVGKNDVQQNGKTAMQWYTKAAQQNHAQAQYNLGVCYRNGWGVDQNDETAVHWYTKAAQQNHAGAQYNLGVCYDNGQGVDQNDEMAVHWYTKAADQNYALAEYNLGVCYDNGRGVLQNDKTAVHWYTKAAQQNYAKAQYNLGWCYDNGRGVLQNDKMAVCWYTKAAEQNHALAQYNLGWCYKYGRGVLQNDKTMAHWYTKAAQQNHAGAQNNLGSCYANGYGVKQDWSMAVHWYQKAADQGNEDAKRWLGTAEEELAKQQKKELEQKQEQERHWERQEQERLRKEKKQEEQAQLQKERQQEEEQLAQQRYLRQQLHNKANSGDTNAQFELGMTLQEGNQEDLGIIEHEQQHGFELLLRAAEGGHLAAQCAVAKCYEMGKGGVPEQDEHMAFSWYEMAAQDGSAEGMFHFGRCYENGIGVDAVDLQQACDWYEKALKCGYKEARCALVKAKANLLASKKKNKNGIAGSSALPSFDTPRVAFVNTPAGLNAEEISVILDGYGSTTIQDDHFESKLAQLEEVETTLVKWLALLAAKEVQSGQKSGPQELVWVKLTARVYHFLVPMWQQKFERTFDSSDKVDVFISHTGVDKDDYASSLSGYLSDKGVSTFLDRRSLRPGDNPQESMIEALVTCRRMWCVVTKDFVGNWYPMRELWIGYTRYQREDPNRFCLIVDCLEKQRSRSGALMDQLLGSVQAVEPHDENGERYPFPTMIPARNAEGFFERYDSISHQELADGKSILPAV